MPSTPRASESRLVTMLSSSEGQTSPSGLLCAIIQAEADTVDNAPAHFHLFLQGLSGIQTEKKEPLTALPCKAASGKLSRRSGRVNHLSLPFVPSGFTLPIELGNQTDQNRRALSYSDNPAEILHGSGENSVKRAELLQESMGKRVGVPPGNGIEQKKLQRTHLTEGFRTEADKFLPQTFPMTLMHLFRFHAASLYQNVPLMSSKRRR